MTRNERRKQRYLEELKSQINKIKDYTTLYKLTSSLGIISSFTGIGSYFSNPQPEKLFLITLCTGYSLTQLASLVDNVTLLEELKSILLQVNEEEPRLSLRTYNTLTN